MAGLIAVLILLAGIIGLLIETSRRQHQGTIQERILYYKDLRARWAKERKEWLEKHPRVMTAMQQAIRWQRITTEKVHAMRRGRKNGG